MFGLWIPAVINLTGVRQMAWFQNVTVVLKFLPLLFVGVVGWFFVARANFGPFNASGGSLYNGIGIAAGVALFSFIGVEAAAITAKRVKNPRTNVLRASVIGTVASAFLYVLVTAVVMGLVAHHTLVNTGSPFVNAFQTMFPHSAWAGQFVAGVAVVSGLGALIAWTLIVTETSRAIAQDDLFRDPSHGPIRGVRPGSASLWAPRYRRCDALALLDEFWSDGLYVPRGSERGDRRHPVFLLGDCPVDVPRLQASPRPGLAVGS